MTSCHQGKFTLHALNIERKLQRSIPSRVSRCYPRPKRVRERDNSTEVFHNNADMETLLHVEAVEVFTLDGNRGVHRLLENLSPMLDLLGVTRERDLIIPVEPV